MLGVIIVIYILLVIWLMLLGAVIINLAHAIADGEKEEEDETDQR